MTRKEEITESEWLAEASALRRKLLGDRMTDAIAAAMTPFDQPFQDYAVRNVFGGPWLNGVISKRELALVNVGMLAGLGRFEEAGVYMEVCLRLGVTALELQELLLHITAYSGTPVGRQLFRIAKQLLAAHGIDVSDLDEQGRSDPTPVAP
jgi:4-carboxymuconolactone decarboxylase